MILSDGSHPDPSLQKTGKAREAERPNTTANPNRAKVVVEVTDPTPIRHFEDNTTSEVSDVL